MAKESVGRPGTSNNNAAGKEQRSYWTKMDSFSSDFTCLDSNKSNNIWCNSIFLSQQSVKTSQHPASVSSVLNANHLWKPVSSSLYMWLQPIGLLLLLLLVRPNTQGTWFISISHLYYEKWPHFLSHMFGRRSDWFPHSLFEWFYRIYLMRIWGPKRHVTNKSKQHRTGVCFGWRTVTSLRRTCTGVCS